MYTSNGVNINIACKVVLGKIIFKDIQPISTVLEFNPFKKKVMSFILTIYNSPYIIIITRRTTDKLSVKFT